jgi:DNA-dependent RNA polymerase auxiliary subunit epsilon
MSKKYFEVKIDITSQTWEIAYAYVEAETEEEARKLFEDNPYDYDWDGWETFDSEIRHWEVDTVDYDKWMTESMERRDEEKRLTERMKAEDLND